MNPQFVETLADGTARLVEERATPPKVSLPPGVMSVAATLTAGWLGTHVGR